MDEQIGTESDSLKTIGDEIDKFIAKAIIENPSITDQALANSLNISRQTINRRRNSDQVKQMISEIIAIPQDEIRRLSAKAMSKLVHLITDLDPRIALTASLGILKIGIELRDTFKEPEEYILGLTNSQKKNMYDLKMIEMQGEYEKLDTFRKLNQAKVDEQIAEMILADIKSQKKPKSTE